MLTHVCVRFPIWLGLESADCSSAPTERIIFPARVATQKNILGMHFIDCRGYGGLATVVGSWALSVVAARWTGGLLQRQF